MHACDDVVLQAFMQQETQAYLGTVLEAVGKGTQDMQGWAGVVLRDPSWSSF